MADTTTTPTPSVGRAAFTFILIMVAFDFLAFGIIVPVLPDLIRSFEGGDFARASAITGYFGFAWNAMQFIFSPLLGAWSDRFGRRPVILISCFGLSIDYIFMALAPSLTWLFVGRLISGITASNVSTAFAYITDVTPPEKRPKQFGLISAAFGLGFIVGPCGRRLPWQHQSPVSLLGRRRAQSRQRALRLFHPARIASAAAPRQIRLANGQSSGVSKPIPLAC